MGGSCKGGCLEEAEAQLVFLYFYSELHFFGRSREGLLGMLEDSLGVE